MKVSELFLNKQNYNPRKRDVHLPSTSLPIDNIRRKIDTMYSTDIPYLDVLRKIRDDFGEDAMIWAKQYIRNKHL